MIMTSAVRIRKMVAGLGIALPAFSTPSRKRTTQLFFSRVVFLDIAILLFDLYLFFSLQKNRSKVVSATHVFVYGGLQLGHGLLHGAAGTGDIHAHVAFAFGLAEAAAVVQAQAGFINHELG